METDLPTGSEPPRKTCSPDVWTAERLTAHLTSFDLVSVQMKDWVLILKAEFDFYLGPETQPIPAIILILRPQDGKYFVSVLSKVYLPSILHE